MTTAPLIDPQKNRATREVARGECSIGVILHFAPAKCNITPTVT